MQVVAGNVQEKRAGLHKNVVGGALLPGSNLVEKVRNAEQMLKKQQQQLMKLQQGMAKMAEDNAAISQLLQEALQRQ